VLKSSSFIRRGSPGARKQVNATPPRVRAPRSLTGCKATCPWLARSGSRSHSTTWCWAAKGSASPGAVGRRERAKHVDLPAAHIETPPPAQLVWWRGLDGALATHGPGLHVHGGVQGAAGVGVQGAPGEEGLQLGPRRGAVTGPGGTHGLADVGGGGLGEVMTQMGVSNTFRTRDVPWSGGGREGRREERCFLTPP